jgi:8-amino-7-oxononanoate synthase
MNPEEWISGALEQDRECHLERSLSVYGESGGIIADVGARLLNLSSNNYLDLLHHPLLIQAACEAIERYGTGAGASRLVSGNLPIHEELEAALATAKGYPAALVFGSGFLANVGIVTACVGRDDTVFADRLVHASLIDGIVQSRATLKRFNHNDVNHLADLMRKDQRTGRRLVITESVFSMDGDLAPLLPIAEVCREYDAMLMVDEAHATGLFGPLGAGRVDELKLQSAVNLSAGTLSKALAGYGGYVACSNAMRNWLINRARTFIYSTAIPPGVVAAAYASLRILREDPTRGSMVLQRARTFRHRLQEEGFDTLESQSQIIPVLIGDNERTLRIAKRLLGDGIVAIAIRPPTVPEGTARLRLSITFAHTDEDLDRAAEAIARAIHETK